MFSTRSDWPHEVTVDATWRSFVLQSRRCAQRLSLSPCFPSYPTELNARMWWLSSASAQSTNRQTCHGMPSHPDGRDSGSMKEYGQPEPQRVWGYPNQQGMVGPEKLTTWFLRMQLSFVLIYMLRQFEKSSKHINNPSATKTGTPKDGFIR